MGVTNYITNTYICPRPFVGIGTALPSTTLQYGLSCALNTSLVIIRTSRVTVRFTRTAPYLLEISSTKWKLTASSFSSAEQSVHLTPRADYLPCLFDSTHKHSQTDDDRHKLKIVLRNPNVYKYHSLRSCFRWRLCLKDGTPYRMNEWIHVMKNP